MDYGAGRLGGGAELQQGPKAPPLTMEFQKTEKLLAACENVLIELRGKLSFILAPEPPNECGTGPQTTSPVPLLQVVEQINFRLATLHNQIRSLTQRVDLS